MLNPPSVIIRYFSQNLTFRMRLGVAAFLRIKIQMQFRPGVEFGLDICQITYLDEGLMTADIKKKNFPLLQYCALLLYNGRSFFLILQMLNIRVVCSPYFFLLCLSCVPHNGLHQRGCAEFVSCSYFRRWIAQQPTSL